MCQDNPIYCLLLWPLQIDITKTIKNQIEGKPRARKSDMADTTKAKLARKRQKETLKFIQQQQAEAASKATEEDAVAGPSSASQNWWC